MHFAPLLAAHPGISDEGRCDYTAASASQGLAQGSSVELERGVHLHIGGIL